MKKKEYLECEHCKKKKPDVSYRPDPYGRDIGDDPSAMHTVCDDCNYESAMDI